MKHFNLFNRLILLIVATTAISVNVWGNYYATVTVQTNHPTGKGSVYVESPGTTSAKKDSGTSSNTDVTFTIGATTPTGYTWNGWTCNPNATSLPTGTTGTIKVKTASKTGEDNANKYTVTANFTAKTYNMYLDANEGVMEGGATSWSRAATDNPALTFDSGNYNDVTWLKPSRTGYTFLGYFDNDGVMVYTANCAANNDGKYWNSSNYAFDGDLSAKAKWTPIAYTITYTNVDGATNPNPATYTIEDAITFAPADKAGYTFNGWSPTSIAKGSTGAKTVTASWTANTYTVTLDNQGATTAGTTSVTATSGAAMPTITVPTKTGYTFAGYFDATSGGTKYYNTDGTSAHVWDKAANTKLYAQWTANVYTVTLNPNGGTPGATYSVPYLTTLPNSTKPTKEGFIFMGYFDNDGKQYYDANMTPATWDKTANYTLYAKWKGLQLNYNLNYAGANQTNLFTGWTGTVTSGGLTMTYDPATGYITINGTSSGSTSAIVQDFPTFATGDVISYAVTDYAGSRSSNDGCQVFETCNFFGTAPSGTNRQNLDFRANASKLNQTIQAGFNYMKFWIWYNTAAVTYTDLKFKLRVEKGASLASVAAPSGKYITGSTYGILADAPTREGYQFEGWYTEPECTNKVTESTIFNGTANQVLYAHWVTSLTPSITGSNQTMLVDATQSPAFTFENAPSPVAHITVKSISGVNDGSGNVITYDKTTNTIKAVNAGVAEIYFTQAETETVSEYKSATYTYTVNKYDNTLAWGSASDMSTASQQTVQATSNSDATIAYSGPDATYGRYDATNHILYSNDKTGTLVVTATQAETYKYKGATATLTVNVSRPNNHLEMNISNSTQYGYYAQNASNVSYSSTIDFAKTSATGGSTVRSVEFAFVGIPNKLSFTGKTDANWPNNPTWVWYYRLKGQTNFVEIDRKTPSNQNDINVDCSLLPNVDAIKITYAGVQNAGHIGDLKVTERTGVEGTSSIDFGAKLKDKDAIERPATISWYNVLPMTVSITEDADNMFELVSGPTSITSNLDKYGENIGYTIRYKSTSSSFKQHTAKLVFKDINGTELKTITLTGETKERWDRTVTTDIVPTACKVDDANLNLASLWTMSGDGTPTYEVTSWTSAGGNTDGQKTNTALSGSTLTLGEAGTVTVKMSVPQTTEYNAKTVEKTITISRYANPLVATIAGIETLERYVGLDDTYTISATSANSRTGITITPNTSVSTPVLLPLQPAEGSLTFTTDLTEGDATFTISQPQDYKYEGINETATVHVGQGNVCTVYNEYTTETNLNSSYDKGGSGVNALYNSNAHVWTFTAKRASGSDNVTARAYYSREWHDLQTLPLTDTYQTFTYVLPSTTIENVRINGLSNNNRIYIKNAIITQTTTITPHGGQALNMSKIKGEADLDSTITITHNTCGDIKVRITGENANMFAVTDMGSNTYKVTYKKSDAAGTHTANIIFYDHNTKATMTVNGTTTEMQDPVWKCDIADSYNVEQVDKLDLQTLWTSNQRDASPYSPRQYSIVFTPDGGNHDGATGVNLTENRYLTLGDAGTVNITMTQAANAFYYGKTETKEVTINRLANTMTFTLNGVVGATASTMNLGEGMNTIITTTNTDTVYAEQTDGFKSGTYYRSWNAVYAAATTGDVTVHAWQPQNYKYEGCEGNFTITVKEMDMTQCEALTYTGNITLNNNGYTTTELSLTGEGNVLTYTLGVQYLGNQKAGEADNDSTRYWIEYKTATSDWQILGEKALPSAGNKTINNVPADATQIRFGMEKAAKYQETPLWTTYDRVTTLTFSSINISRATYLKVGADEASVTEGDITLNEPIAPITIHSGENVQKTFVIAYSTCDQTANDHIRIQCNRGAAAVFSEDNINTEAANGGVHTITMAYTPKVWCSADTLDTVVVAVYNRSVRRRVYMYVRVLPYTLNGNNWNDASHWAGGNKPESSKCGVVVAGDATVDVDATVGSIEVAEGATLTIANGKKLTVDGSTQPLKPATDLGNIRVQADATLLVKAGSLNINKLDLEGGLYTIEEETGKVTKFGVPYVQLDSTASIHRSDTVVDYYLNIDAQHYYAFAVPFEVPLTSIKYVGTDYDYAKCFDWRATEIDYYDGEARAKQNTSTQSGSIYWKPISTTGNLQPGVGYIISALPFNGTVANLQMTMNVDNAWLTLGEQGQVGEVVRNAMAVKENAGSGSTRWNNKGWNFIANPFLSSNKIAAEQLDLLHIQDSVGMWGDYEPNTENIKFVTIPDYYMTDYDQIPSQDMGNNLKPFMPFFIQADKDGVLQFNSIRKHNAPARWNARPTSTYPEQRIYLSLRGNEMKESLGLMIQEDYTAEYDYNADLVKMMGEANTLRGYLTYGNNNMAYLALNETLAEEAIPMTVRIPAMNLYTWSLKESSRTDMLDAVYLTDVVENKVINLLNEDYTFSANEGLLQGRFFLNAVLNPNRQPTDIRDAANATDEDAQKMIFRNHLYIVHKGIVYDGQGQRIMQIKK